MQDSIPFFAVGHSNPLNVGYRACHTALRMLDALQALQPRWQARGLLVIHIGIGITSGTMIVGNMGSDLRFSYTVMGDEVNRGARLEGVTKEYGTPIIISEATWEHIKDRLATRELDIIRVKGKTGQRVSLKYS